MILKWEGYTNCGGCQMDEAMPVIAAGRKPLVGSHSYSGVWVRSAIKWFIENPAQQVQWQNGEQSSGCCWSLGLLVLDNSVFPIPSFAATPISAQGITLSAKTRKAIMKDRNFIGCKTKLYYLLITNQKIKRCCRGETIFNKGYFFLKNTEQEVLILNGIVWSSAIHLILSKATSNLADMDA